MHPALAAIASRQGGVFTTAQAYDCGYTEGEIQSLRRSKTWTTLRRGVYAETALVARAGAEARHQLMVHALMCQLTAFAVVSHVSAAVMHGLPLLDANLASVHVTRGDGGTSRRSAGVVHHLAALPEAHLTEVSGVPVTALTRTALDIAREASLAQGVVVADAVLRNGATREQLDEVLDFCRDWPGARLAAHVAGFARPGAESVGESLARVVMAAEGLPEPQLQVEVFDADGLVGRVDFLWEEQGTVGEFDGRVKYGPGADLDPDEMSDVLWREKRREDRLRAAGFEVVRFTWGDCLRQGVIGERVRRAFARAHRPRRLAG